MGLNENIFKHKSPSSRVFIKYSLHGIQDFNTIMFDDYCRYTFDPGGTQLPMLWVLKNPHDMRTYPLQE